MIPEMKPIHVVFAVPSAMHAPKLPFVQSVLAMSTAALQAGIGHTIIWSAGDIYLDKVRDHLVSRALRDHPEMTHFFFLDDDVSFPAQAAIDLILAPFKVRAGIYPKKHDDLQFPVSLLHDAATLRPIEQHGFFRASSIVPTGFLCIDADVLREQAKTAKRYKDLDGSINWSLFRCGFVDEPQPDGTDGQYWGEDTWWCRKYLEAGGEIWVKADIGFGHTGTKTWAGNLMDRVRVARDGTAAWSAEGQLTFFAPGAAIPEGWTTENPQLLAAD